MVFKDVLFELHRIGQMIKINDVEMAIRLLRQLTDALVDRQSRPLSG